MTNVATHDSLVGLEPEVDAFIRSLLDHAAAIRLPEVFGERPAEALYWVGDRHGVTTVALRTRHLSENQLLAILTFRLAQYLMAHQLDPRLIHAQRLLHEPLSGVTPDDVHVITGAAGTGEMLAYGTFKALAGIAPRTTMRESDRPLFPVEEVFGRGLFDQLKILPDLPVHRVREAGRLMKNHQYQALDELIIRAPVEAVLCGFRLVAGLLHHEIDACIGDVEMGVAKKNQDFFHLPTVILRGVVPYATEGSFGFFNYQHRTRYPFALLVADISAARLTAIDEALAMPGKEGVAALLALKQDTRALPSSLEPVEGLAQLDDTPILQEGVPMAARRQLLDLGEWLRNTTLFRCLSVAEATVLGTFLEPLSFEAGAYVVRHGDPGDDVFLIKTGMVEVKLSMPDGRYLKVRDLGPGDYFGEIALIAGGERTADVIASEPLTLLRLSRDAYGRYLARFVDVERDLTKTAFARSAYTLRTHRPDHD